MLTVRKFLPEMFDKNLTLSYHVGYYLSLKRKLKDGVSEHRGYSLTRVKRVPGEVVFKQPRNFKVSRAKLILCMRTEDNGGVNHCTEFARTNIGNFIFIFSEDGKEEENRVYEMHDYQLAEVANEIDFALLAGKRVTTEVYQFYHYLLSQCFPTKYDEIHYVEFKKSKARNYDNSVSLSGKGNTVGLERIVKYVSKKLKIK